MKFNVSLDVGRSTFTFFELVDDVSDCSSKSTFAVSDSTDELRVLFRVVFGKAPGSETFLDSKAFLLAIYNISYVHKLHISTWYVDVLHFQFLPHFCFVYQAVYSPLIQHTLLLAHLTVDRLGHGIRFHALVATYAFPFLLHVVHVPQARLL